jgi:hypothetical protein
VTLTASAVFFSWPLSFAEWRQNAVTASDNGGPVTPREFVFPRDGLPPQILAPLRRDMKEPLQIRELARRGSLTLDGSTLTVGPVGANVVLTIAVHTLTLQHGSRIVTNGNALTIQAVRIVGGGSIVSFLPESQAPASVPAGAPGISGHDGGTVYLDAIKGIDGNLEIDLSGQNGGPGGQGASGSAGPAGARGSDGVPGLFDCKSGGGNGSKGGTGSPGQPGGVGGDGGNGGELVLSKSLFAPTGQNGPPGGPIPPDQIHFIANGGSPGLSGARGPRGPGGPGGQGGSGNGLCSGGSPGPQGDPGPTGTDGHDGTPGRKGQMTAQK